MKKLINNIMFKLGYIPKPDWKKNCVNILKTTKYCEICENNIINYTYWLSNYDREILHLVRHNIVQPKDLFEKFLKDKI